MSDLLTHVARLEMVDVDLDKEPQCEGLAHGTTAFGHDGGPAKYRVTFPCSCSPRSVLACVGRARTFAKDGGHCGICGDVAEPYEIQIFEL